MDCSCTIYHTMLTKKQAEQLEKIQRDIFKIIFGFERSYAKIIEEESLEYLYYDRRQKLFDDFTLKESISGRYKD